MAIVWRGDDARRGDRAPRGLEDFVERSLEGAEASEGAWELDGGWAAVGGEGDVVTLALAPDEATADRLARPAGRVE